MRRQKRKRTTRRSRNTAINIFLTATGSLFFWSIVLSSTELCAQPNQSIRSGGHRSRHTHSVAILAPPKPDGYNSVFESSVEDHTAESPSRQKDRAFFPPIMWVYHNTTSRGGTHWLRDYWFLCAHSILLLLFFSNLYSSLRTFVHIKALVNCYVAATIIEKREMSWKSNGCGRSWWLPLLMAQLVVAVVGEVVGCIVVVVGGVVGCSRWWLQQ